MPRQTTKNPSFVALTGVTAGHRSSKDSSFTSIVHAPGWFALILFCAAMQAAVAAAAVRDRQNIDQNWKFLLADSKGAESPTFDDSKWRVLELPHDWSIEGTFDFKSATGAREAYLPQGIGWYRYEFTAPAEWKTKTVTMEFEGVYMNARFWLNGEKIADHPYGYTSFFLDLSKAKWGEKNVIAVRIDNSGQLNSRWYPGSGIERHVWMNVANPTHLAPWGVYVVTKAASSDAAQIELEARVQSASPAGAPLVIRTAVVDSSGKTVATTESPLASGDAKESSVKQHLQITRPSLWSPESPDLYHAHVSLVQEGKVVDECSTPFGVRTLKWSAEKGLELNGKSIKLAGGCIHQCDGALGAACFDRGEERRIQLLKAAGFNALRLAHGPASPALLDACDRLGMLVMAEAFDCWDVQKVPYDYHLYFNDWWLRDLDSFVLRDRNHPSIVMWSIGNEIRGQYEATAYATGEQISARLRSMDTTRPITQAMNVRPRKTEAAMAAWDAYCARALDIVGTNYRLEVVVQDDHLRVPERVVASTEEVPSDAFRYWMLTLHNSCAVGNFVWSAWDYLGESSNGHWVLSRAADEDAKVRRSRAHGSGSGDLNEAGERKDISYYRNIVCDRGEKLHLTVQLPLNPGEKIELGHWSVYPTSPSWNWRGFEGQQVNVEVYSRYASVRLYQDGKLVGEQPTTVKEEYKTTFQVNYQPGSIKAVGMTGGQEVDERSIATAGAAVRLKLTPDRKQLEASGQDLSFIWVEAVDRDGNRVPDTSSMVSFELKGAGTIAGVCNGDLYSTEPYRASQRSLYHGVAQVVVRTTHQVGDITLKAVTRDLQPGTTVLHAE